MKCLRPKYCIDVYVHYSFSFFLLSLVYLVVLLSTIDGE